VGIVKDFDDTQPEPLDQIESLLLICVYIASAALMAFLTWKLLGVFL
jgi:hypothetical protein